MQSNHHIYSIIKLLFRFYYKSPHLFSSRICNEFNYSATETLLIKIPCLEL